MGAKNLLRGRFKEDSSNSLIPLMIDLLKKIKLYGFKKFLRYTLDELFNILWMQTFRGSYSQLGEDLVIDQLLNYKDKGVYVDIGAHHPTRLSNTKRFYNRGWRGINVDPNPFLIKKFKEERKEDINLILGVGKKNGFLFFYEFFPSTLSTLSAKEAKKYINEGFKLVSQKKVPVKTLSFILEKYCKNKVINFLSVDTEGMDLEVLQSNNWKKYKPQVICVENHGNNKNILNFLKEHGYQLKYNNGLNSIFSVL